MLTQRLFMETNLIITFIQAYKYNMKTFEGFLFFIEQLGMVRLKYLLEKIDIKASMVLINKDMPILFTNVSLQLGSVMAQCNILNTKIKRLLRPLVKRAIDSGLKLNRSYYKNTADYCFYNILFVLGLSCCFIVHVTSFFLWHTCQTYVKKRLDFTYEEVLNIFIKHEHKIFIEILKLIKQELYHDSFHDNFVDIERKIQDTVENNKENIFLQGDDANILVFRDFSDLIDKTVNNSSFY